MQKDNKRIIGLVGGICSAKYGRRLRLGGKSTILSILRSKGCYCIDCDKLGHKVYISKLPMLNCQ